MTVHVFSALPSIATQVVPQHLLGELPPAASDVGDLKPYLGRYVANFRTFSNDVFTIFQRIFQADRVEVGVALPPGTFTLQPSTESYRKQ